VDNTARKELLRRAWKRLRGGELTASRAAVSVMIGLAVGVTPLWGTHWMIVLALTVPLRLDAGLALLASNVSLPFVAPFITLTEVELGARLLRGTWLPVDPRGLRREDLTPLLGEVAIGTLLVAVATAALGGALTYALVTLRSRRRAPLP
jgi:uncharacterized protein (DUF2062 family)